MTDRQPAYVPIPAGQVYCTIRHTMYHHNIELRMISANRSFLFPEKTAIATLNQRWNDLILQWLASLPHNLHLELRQERFISVQTLFQKRVSELISGRFTLHYIPECKAGNEWLEEKNKEVQREMKLLGGEGVGWLAGKRQTHIGKRV